MPAHIVSMSAGTEPIRFRDRKQAGRLLAEKLRSYAIDASAIVLGLPRGGVVTASEVAAALDLPLDVIIVRKLGAPWQPELAMGAIASGGIRVLNDDVVRALRIPQSKIDEATKEEQTELARREKLFRGDLPPLALTGKTVIMIDDGIATGSTVLAAIRCIRAQNPSRIVLAVPVAPPTTCERLQPEVDDLICLSTPDDFSAVGEWYDKFAQVEDAEVVELMRKAAARELVPH
ncbi:MAG TPA: phosphoribosyltransferase [Thermoanaerobaculia bacterium]